MRVQLNGPNDRNWTAMYQTGLSKRLKVDGPKGEDWSILADGTGRSKNMELVSINDSGQSKRQKLEEL